MPSPNKVKPLPNAVSSRVNLPVVAFSTGMASRNSELKRFLFQNLYRHPQVVDTTTRAQQVVRELFAAYLEDPAQMPEAHARRSNTARAVADYLAGMTDRFAAREHERLTGKRLLT